MAIGYVPLVGKHAAGVSVGVAVAVAVGCSVGVAVAVGVALGVVVAVAVAVCVMVGVAVAVAVLVGGRPSRMTCGKNTGVASALAARGVDGFHARANASSRASKTRAA
jgi:hypothetical protein